MTTEASSRPRILCVDDEPAVLDGLRRTLRARFDVSTATDGAAGLELIARGAEFAVVVSDMRMPGLDGAAFLARVRAAMPDAVRVLLTGQADVASAIAAVNDGAVFRFLCKPCPSDVLTRVLDAAVEQHRLVIAERELLEKTLWGSVRALWETLALANPAAFGRAARIRRTAVRLAGRLALPDVWRIDVAASLGQLGAVALPPGVSQKLDHGARLTPAEEALVGRVPALAERLLRTIPRLEEVRRIIRYQDRGFDGGGAPSDGVKGPQLPPGSRVLRAAADFDAQQSAGLRGLAAVRALEARREQYDPAVLEALAELAREESRQVTCDVPVSELHAGAVLADDVRARSGALLVARGTEVTDAMLEHLRNFALGAGVCEPVRIQREPG